MKSTSFCYCLTILIVCLSNFKVQSHRISSSSARYTGPNEQNKITNSSSSSKISSTDLRPSDRRPYNREELASTAKQDTKRSGIELSTTKYQNSQRSNLNVPTEKGVTAERDTSTQFGRSASSPNQNWRPSAPDQASGIASDAQTSRNSTASKPAAAYSPSLVAGRTDNQVASMLPTGVRAEPTTILTNERWTSTPSSASTSTKFGSRFAVKATTTGALITSSPSRSSSTTVGLGHSSTTESSATRAGKTKEKDNEIVFPAATSARTTSKTATPQWPTSSDNGNAIPSGFSTTLFPSTNDTGTGNTTEKTDNKFLIDAPPFKCKEGERKDTNKECRKVL